MRKTASVTITAEGRDKGKTFFLTEMAARPAEDWAIRALLALGRSGVEIPDEMAGAGMAAIATIGIRAFAGMAFDDAGPLLDEMMGCVQFVPDPSKSEVKRALVEAGPDGEGADIEEVATRLHLRSEVVALHVGFSLSDMLSKLGAMAKMRLQDSSNIQTSPAPLEPSSPPDSPA